MNCKFSFKSANVLAFLVVLQIFQISFVLGQISYRDPSLSLAKKYVLRVDGKPYYGTNVQIRLDKLTYYWGFGASARDSIVGQAASDGFNTVSIPINWYEVETSKDTFNWTILDEYLGLCKKYNLKMELLWFGANSGGHVQWLGDPSVNPIHLRTPDYVFYAPSTNSSATTSDYTIVRSGTTYPNWILDITDNNYKARETFVLGQVMDHIATWDASNGSKHVVIGVQLNNEFTGPWTSAQLTSYLSAIGSAVKNSSYVVWTRMNTVWGDQTSRINSNESARSSGGTNLDFVGVDLYGANASTIRTILPYAGGNYRMIMESGAEVSSAPIYQMAALSGNNAYDHYDMLGPDGHGLYDRQGATGFVANGGYVADVRTVNKILNSDQYDIAINAQGYGLYVHNYAGNSSSPTIGVEGITFTPNSTSSQGISIRRSNTELVLMNTKGGTFNFPASLGITGATYGYFDNNNSWISQGSLSFTSTSISPSAGTTIRLTRPNTGEYASIRRQAEFASVGGGATIESSVLGFAGNGYVNFNSTGGYIQWSNVDGLSGGTQQIRFRFALTGTPSQTRTMKLTVNGVAQNITFSPSDPSTLENYGLFTVSVSLNSGTTNSIKLESTGQDGPNIDELQTLQTGMLAPSQVSVEKAHTNAESSKITIFPNPVADVLIVNLPKGYEEASLHLRSSNGATIIEEKLTSSTNKISVKSLPPGIYYAQINCGKILSVQKLVKQ